MPTTIQHAPATSASERASAAVADLFSKLAPHYAQSRPTYPGELFDWLATHCAGRALAWDAGAGNGQASVALAAHFSKVVATDLSAQQLAHAPEHPRIEYRAAPAHRSGLPDRSVDLVCAAQALHWFDVDDFHAEARRVLRPGGLIAEWAYGVVRVEGEAVHAIVSDFYWNVLGAFWPDERRHVENGYLKLPFPFPRIAAPAFAMRLRWDLARLLGYVRSWSASARMQTRTGIDPADALGRRLAAAWGPAQQAREIRWPMALRVGTR